MKFFRQTDNVKIYLTLENFIGSPNDKILYQNALELFKQRMKKYPEIVVTDLGYHSQDNFNFSIDKVENVFLGRSNDVKETYRDFSKKT
ncbi:hypothetical protein GMMP1_220029 [Candidatus Magnetomoraceae bacterium gMMP-1]